jgi:hypothetical protein
VPPLNSAVEEVENIDLEASISIAALLDDVTAGLRQLMESLLPAAHFAPPIFP